MGDPNSLPTMSRFPWHPIRWRSFRDRSRACLCPSHGVQSTPGARCTWVRGAIPQQETLRISNFELRIYRRSAKIGEPGTTDTYAPVANHLRRPLRWFMAETATAFPQASGSWGHFGGRRYPSCPVEEEPYAVAKLRCVDLHPVQTGMVNDPTIYLWSRCAIFHLTMPSYMLTFHSIRLGPNPNARVRWCQYPALPSTRPTREPGRASRRRGTAPHDGSDPQKFAGTLDPPKRSPLPW